MKTCLLAAASVGLPIEAGMKIARAAAAGALRPSVIWLHFQECTGCTETLLRTSAPDVAKLILELISLDYHETLYAAAGEQVEEVLHRAVDQFRGHFVLVVEGAIPTRDGGVYCKIAGKTAMDMLTEVSEAAGAVIAIGSCASFGGLPAAEPNPTGAVGVGDIVEGAVVNLPGCPPNPYNLLGTVLQYVSLGTLPALDDQGRPLFAYGQTIHEHCQRRPHFDAGRFAGRFGDEKHREGHCLYQLGCKGPQTHANCSTKQFGEVGAWPIGIGHPCVGCTEKNLLWRTAIHETVNIEHPTAPAHYPELEPRSGRVSPIATGVGGLLVGAGLGAGFMLSKKLTESENEKEV